MPVASQDGIGYSRPPQSHGLDLLWGNGLCTDSLVSSRAEVWNPGTRW
uniref:Uncharacterized protein n=1 Tax=Trichinella nativa TaxID=6335 RepID=A0A0V1KH13_9BILA